MALLLGHSLLGSCSAQTKLRARYSPQDAASLDEIGRCIDEATAFLAEWGTVTVSAPMISTSADYFRFDPQIADTDLVQGRSPEGGSARTAWRSTFVTLAAGSSALETIAGLAAEAAKNPASTSSQSTTAQSDAAAKLGKMWEEFENLDEKLQGSLRRQYRAAASDKFELGLHRFLSDPSNALPDSYRPAFVVFTVHCQPGWRTREGYVGRVTVEARYEAPLLPDPTAREAPLVTAIYPSTETQDLMLVNAVADRSGGRVAASGSGIAAGLSTDGGTDVGTTTRTGLNVTTAFISGGGQFGYEFRPTYRATRDLNRLGSNPGFRLDPVAFPAVAIVGLRRGDWRFSDVNQALVALADHFEDSRLQATLSRDLIANSVWTAESWHQVLIEGARPEEITLPKSLQTEVRKWLVAKSATISTDADETEPPADTAKKKGEPEETTPTEETSLVTLLDSAAKTLRAELRPQAPSLPTTLSLPAPPNGAESDPSTEYIEQLKAVLTGRKPEQGGWLLWHMEEVRGRFLESASECLRRADPPKVTSSWVTKATSALTNVPEFNRQLELARMQPREAEGLDKEDAKAIESANARLRELIRESCFVDDMAADEITRRLVAGEALDAGVPLWGSDRGRWVEALNRLTTQFKRTERTSSLDYSIEPYVDSNNEVPTAARFLAERIAHCRPTIKVSVSDDEIAEAFQQLDGTLKESGTLAAISGALVGDGSLAPTLRRMLRSYAATVSPAMFATRIDGSSGALNIPGATVAAELRAASPLGSSLRKSGGHTDVRQLVDLNLGSLDGDTRGAVVRHLSWALGDRELEFRSTFDWRREGAGIFAGLGAPATISEQQRIRLLANLDNALGLLRDLERRKPIPGYGAVERETIGRLRADLARSRSQLAPASSRIAIPNLFDERLRGTAVLQVRSPKWSGRELQFEMILLNGELLEIGTRCRLEFTDSQKPPIQLSLPKERIMDDVCVAIASGTGIDDGTFGQFITENFKDEAKGRLVLYKDDRVFATSKEFTIPKLEFKPPAASPSPGS